MCIALLAQNRSPRYPLVVALNRDEFFGRPTEAAHFWDHSGILAGKDTVTGGTWFGVTRSGRVGIVTNIREGHAAAIKWKTRGHLVPGFLEGELSSLDYATTVAADCEQYSPFNLLLWDGQQMSYVSSRSAPRKISDGIIALSNGELNEDWPKVRRGTALLTDVVSCDNESEQLVSRLFEVLADRTRPLDSELPDTGVGIEVERTLSSVFIDNTSGDYGTRTSTILLVDNENHVVFAERTFTNDGELWNNVEIAFALSPRRSERP